MADRSLKTKKRRLQLPSTNAKRTEAETKRPRLHKVRTAVGKPFRIVGRLPIWKPFRFVGRFIIPPYIRKSWQELRYVTWPNGKQTRQLTLAVIMFALVFGLIVAGFDWVLDKLFKELLLR